MFKNSVKHLRVLLYQSYLTFTVGAKFNSQVSKTIHNWHRYLLGNYCFHKCIFMFKTFVIVRRVKCGVMLAVEVIYRLAMLTLLAFILELP